MSHVENEAKIEGAHNGTWEVVVTLERHLEMMEKIYGSLSLEDSLGSMGCTGLADYGNSGRGMDTYDCMTEAYIAMKWGLS